MDKTIRTSCHHGLPHSAIAKSQQRSIGHETFVPQAGLRGAFQLGCSLHNYHSRRARWTNPQST
jgi:hypothetical protein